METPLSPKQNIILNPRETSRDRKLLIVINETHLPQSSVGRVWQKISKKSKISSMCHNKEFFPQTPNRLNPLACFLGGEERSTKIPPNSLDRS